MTPAIGAALGATVAVWCAAHVLAAAGAAPPEAERPARPVPARVRHELPALERGVDSHPIPDAARRLDDWLGGAASVRRRLDRLGDQTSVEEFRLSQIAWGAAGAVVGFVMALLISTSKGSVQPVPLLAMCILAAAAGVILRDRRLTTQVQQREERMLAELPTIAEMLALAVSAGESASGAVQRVAARSNGELAREVRRALAETAAGAPLVRALEAMADRSGVPAMTRFVDGMVVAVERGTPLADVLRAQAVDVREAGRRGLLETGARKEILMMVPSHYLRMTP